jgi:ribosomal protein L2
MAVRFTKPYNPSTRFRAVSDFGDLSRIRPSSLNCRKRALAGRNSSGVTTLRFVEVDIKEDIVLLIFIEDLH